MTRIACRQLAPVFGNVPANVELSCAAIRAAVDDGAGIVVLPELITSGYMFESVAELEAVAISTADGVFARWAAEAGRAGGRGGAVVIGGFPERDADGHIYNSAALVGPDGVIGVYRKAHLWDREKLWFTPGGDPPRVFDTPQGRIGVIVCYDLEFPEMTRTLGLAGAELIAVPTNWPFVDRPTGERAPEVGIAMAAARVNRVFIACCDRAGEERGQTWNQGTSIIDPDGWVIDAVGEVGAATADIDLERTRDKSYTDMADAFGDRRPELYGAVSTTP